MIYIYIFFDIFSIGKIYLFQENKIYLGSEAIQKKNN